MRIVKRVLLSLIVVVLVAVAALGGTVVYLVRKPFPVTNGAIKLPGLKGPVEVVRDAYGVPHIYADTPEDLFMAQGFVHAQDRFFQMEFWRRIGQGRIAELFGKGALTQDKYIRTLGWYRVVEEEVKLLSPEMRGILDNYATGVNAYTSANADRLGVEFSVLALNGASGWKPEPWTPANSLTWGKAMAFDLGDNGDQELARAALTRQGGTALAEAVLPPYPSDMPVITGDRVARAPQPANAAAASAALDPIAAARLIQIGRDVGEQVGLVRGSDIGSNNWVLAGSRTTTGKPLLADDPHLGIQMPSIWYQVGLHCREVNAACPFDVVGVGFAGTPGVVIGHNRRIAWGVTNGTIDTQDWFIERPDPSNPNAFEFKGAFEPAQVREETINVAGQVTPTVITVRTTRHGPIMNDVDSALKDLPPMALSWAALQPTKLLPAVIALNKAQDWPQFREALRDWEIASQNFVYADIDGNIGYQFNGKIPVRDNNRDGTAPAEGWTGANEWIGWIPYEDLPSVYNPPQGYIATANNAIIDSDSPLMLSKRDWDAGWRAKRIVQMIEAKPKHSIDDMHALHFDSTSLFADEALGALFENVVTMQGDKYDQAFTILREWDRRYTRGSRGALIFEMFALKLGRAIYGDEAGPLTETLIGVGAWQQVSTRAALRDRTARWWDDVRTAESEDRKVIIERAFREAVDALEARFGANQNDWMWGKAHIATFKNQTLGQSGVAPIEMLFNRGPFQTDGGSALVNAVGHRATDFSVRSVPSMRMVIDLDNLRNSTLIHTTGQSGHAYHAHYDDMIDKWVNGRTNPLLWTREDVIKNGAGVLQLTP
jgi:penicillin G amidase